MLLLGLAACGGGAGGHDGWADPPAMVTSPVVGDAAADRDDGVPTDDGAVDAAVDTSPDAPDAFDLPACMAACDDVETACEKSCIAEAGGPTTMASGTCNEQGYPCATALFACRAACQNGGHT